MTRESDPFGGPSPIEQSPDHQALAALLLDPSPPFDVDWQTPAHAMRLEERLDRLARLKAIVPDENTQRESLTHDRTLENYIRLALHSAGDRATLNTFLEHVEGALDSGAEGSEMLAQQVFWIWAPVAEIADLQDHKAMLEDKALRILKPEDYEQLERDFEAIDLEGGLLGETRAEIIELIDTLDIDERFSYELQHRAKSKFSAWRKLELEGRSDAEVFDLMGFRIIIDGGDESTAIGQLRYILAAMEDYYESSPQWRMDYIANPKPNGYQSLHQTFTLPNGQTFELQLRTRAMQDESKTGGAHHHQIYDATYKVVPGKIRKNFVKVPRLYQWRNLASLHIEEHGGRTEGILGDKILFFKDDGNLHMTEAGANALDASYAVHNRRALKTRAVSRNGRPMALIEEVNHGDVLGIDYHAEYPTDESRLHRHRLLMTTDLGRRSVEKYMRRLHADSLQDAGRLVVNTMVEELELDDPLSVLNEADRARLAQKAGVPSFEKLLEIIGAGTRGGKPGRIVNVIRVRSGFSAKLAKDEPERRQMPLSDRQVLERVEVPNRDAAPICRVAGCCSGAIHLNDDVLARPSAHHYGVMQLHRTDCGNVENLEGGLLCGWKTEPLK